MNSIELDLKDIMKNTEMKSNKEISKDTLSQKSGIYKIVNKVNGKYYVGSSVNIKQRWKTHIYQLNKGIHNNPKLQFAWNKYGKETFIFEIVETVSVELLEKIEQSYLNIIKNDYINQKDTHYNISYDSNNPMRGRKHTDGFKIKQSERLMGHVHSNETKKKISISSKGRTVSQSTRIKISNSLRGQKKQSYPRNPHSQITCNNIRNSLKNFYSDVTTRKYGNKNGNADNNKYQWFNQKQNKTEIATKWEMYDKYGVNPKETRKLRNGKRTNRGWKIVGII